MPNLSRTTLNKFGKISRKEVEKLLSGKLSDALDDEQKKKKVSNLLTKLRRSGIIENQGNRKNSLWVLAKENME